MDLFTRDDLRQLVNETGKLCVSVLMAAYRGADARQNPIRMRNLLQEAKEQLEGGGLRGVEAEKILRPGMALLADGNFWRNQSSGVAVYMSEGLFRRYRLPLDLPQQVTVNRHFVLKPLLPILSTEGLLYVLAVSQNRVRLLQCTRQETREIRAVNVPESLAEVLRFDVLEKQRQFHTHTPPAGVGVARRPAVFFGVAGPDKRVRKDEILRYFQQIDRGLRGALREQRAPLVFAGVEYLLPIFRQANSYEHLVEPAITGNPDRRSNDELRQRAWEIVEPQLMREQEEALAQYSRAMNSGLASNDIQEIVASAEAGRVGVLLASTREQRWGRYDRQRQEVLVHERRQAGDDDLCDYAAVQTLLHDGKVLLTRPEDTSEPPLAAIYRY